MGSQAYENRTAAGIGLGVASLFAGGAIAEGVSNQRKQEARDNQEDLSALQAALRTRE